MVFKYSMARLFCKKIFFSDVEIKLMDRAVKAIDRDLDITNILDRMKEIEKLKHMLLSDSQMMLFEY